jgi:hypothetical protein
MRATTCLAALAAAAMTAQPVLAADDLRALGTNLEQRTTTFARAHLRVPLGSSGAARERPSARLQLGVARLFQDRQSAVPTPGRYASALEIGLTRRTAQPTLFIGGMPARALERRLGVGTGTGLAIGAGVVLVALVAVAATSQGVPDDFLDE